MTVNTTSSTAVTRTWSVKRGGNLTDKNLLDTHFSFLAILCLQRRDSLLETFLNSINQFGFYLFTHKAPSSFGYQFPSEASMFKMAWNDKKETKEKSKTTIFLQFLLKIFLIPLTIEPIKNEIRFKFWSKPTMFHIMLYWIPFFAIEIYTLYLGRVSGLTHHIESNSSTIEIYSNWMVYITQLSMFLPLMTCYRIGQKKLSADLFLGYAHCPRHAWYNFLAIFLQFFGSLAHMFTFVYTCDLEDDMYITFLLLYIITLFINSTLSIKKSCKSIFLHRTEP